MLRPIPHLARRKRISSVLWGRVAIVAGIGICALALTALAAHPEAGLADDGFSQAGQVLAFPGAP